MDIGNRHKYKKYGVRVLKNNITNTLAGVCLMNEALFINKDDAVLPADT